MSHPVISDDLATNLIQRVAVGDTFRRRAAAVPHQIAVVDHGFPEPVTQTFAQLNSAMNRFVHGARRNNLTQGDKLAILGLNSAEYLIALYGCAKAGIIAVPINPGISPKDLVHILNHAEAKGVVVDSILAPLVNQISGQCPRLETRVAIPIGDAAIPQEFHSFKDFLDPENDTEVEDVIIKDRDTFEILYTSGTTGNAKGVEISHLSVFISSLTTAIEFGLVPGDRTTMMLPIFHCAQQAVTYASLNMGGTVDIIREFNPERVLGILEKVNLSFALPMMYRALIHAPGAQDRDWSALRSCIFAMAPMDQPTLEAGIKRFGARFLLGTGQTECFPPTNLFIANDYMDKRGNYWGQSNMALDTAVMDPSGKLLPPGEVGEIVWRGPLVMTQYYKDEKATRESREFAWHHSGDLGCFDQDGQLLFVDRKKDMIKTGGENVASIKVERCLLGHEGVDQAAVVGLPHPRWSEAVTAFVVRQRDSDLSEDQLIAHCKKELGKFEVPKQVIFLESLPVTATGKVRKNILRQAGSPE